MQLSEVIKNYREENKLSQREFARICGLSNSLISILEMGTNPQTGKRMDPDLRTYRRLANGMGISVAQLFDKLRGSDAMINTLSMSFDGQPVSAEKFHQYFDSKVPEEISELDLQRIEALHQNPKLGMLFDHTRKMSGADVDFMLQMADRILKERDDG